MAYAACIVGGMVAGAVLVLWVILPPDILSIFTASPKEK